MLEDLLKFLSVRNLYVDILTNLFRRRESGREKMERKKQLLSVTLLLLTLIPSALSTFDNFSSQIYTLIESSKSSTNETLSASLFLSDHPQELRLVTNAQLIFIDTAGPPINTSLPAFQDGFIKLEHALTPEVGKFFITFNIFFDLSIDNETVGIYADAIINEFFRVFDYQGLELLWANQGVYQSQIVIHKSFGYLPYTKEEVSKFLQFRPKEGLGIFIESLLNKYVPGNATTGLTASYWLERTPSKLQWVFRVNGMTSSIIPWYPHDYSVVIDVNELLGDDILKITPSNNRDVEISIQTNDTLKLTKGLTTYTITVESIQPEGYTISPSDYPNTVDVKYETLPNENIIIKINIDSSTQGQFDELNRLILYLVVGVSTVLIVWLILRIFFPQYQGILRKKLKEEVKTEK